ncbi:ras association domain-containing protein 2-like [Myxocyprinus asiaticus]|uniref:ras association domain-containing protein 2-like n=1 Tax=Myxocyprinus asiaticus TaxID=70543 RepID=UPI00222290E7|nr:ras association domain-containing protein 2-like [Myxocyprinus asiaticus]XP_051540440.1 ras association domain-containing protein 2-like [Myxocyprinus asiaticus]XP_051540441.1 ras association domain-containing protein 2-like [Myxocyprinus asiaticus]
MDSVDLDKMQIGENKFVSKRTILSHLKTYNSYYEGQALQLRHREEEGELIIEGLLNVFWGVRRQIKLQLQDEKEPGRPHPSLTSPSAEKDISTDKNHETNQASIAADNQSKDSLVEEKEEANTPSQRNHDGQQEVSHSDHLLRIRSDVGGRRIGGRRLGIRRVNRHRCSFNGHFYNHKTAIFTPVFGSVTNVRVNSCMTTAQVLRVLLNKFKIENSPDEFTLYLVHTSGERHQLKSNDHPLAVRILQGPCEQVSKIFLMETDQVEEVTYDVAQYIKFELPVLQSFIAKLQEEEEREILKLKRRYTDMQQIIKRYMQSLADKTT